MNAMPQRSERSDWFSITHIVALLIAVLCMTFMVAVLLFQNPNRYNSVNPCIPVGATILGLPRNYQENSYVFYLDQTKIYRSASFDRCGK